MTWFDPNSGFSEQDFGLQQAKINEQRALYKAMLEKGMGAAPQGQMVSGHFVAPNALQYLNQLGELFVGLQGQKHADKMQSELLASGLKAYKKSMEPETIVEHDSSNPVPMGPPQLDNAALKDALLNAKQGQDVPNNEVAASAPVIDNRTEGDSQYQSPTVIPTDNNGALNTDALKAALAKQQNIPVQSTEQTANQSVIPQGWGASGAATVKQVPADPQKQIMTLIDLAHIQGPIGDMARMRLQNMSKEHKVEFKFGPNGEVLAGDTATGKYSITPGTKEKELSRTETDANGNLINVYTDGTAAPAVDSTGAPIKSLEGKKQSDEMTLKQKELQVKNSGDLAKLKESIVASNDYMSTIGELENMLKSKDVISGKIAGPLGNAVNYLPFVDTTKRDRFNSLVADILVQKMQLMHGLGALSDKDVENMKPIIPNINSSVEANLENLKKLRTALQEKQNVWNARLNDYQQVSEGETRSTPIRTPGSGAGQRANYKDF